MSKRRTHSPEFKAKVAMEAISGSKTLQEVHPGNAIQQFPLPWLRCRSNGCTHWSIR